MTPTAVASYQPSPPEVVSHPRPGAADALPVGVSDGDDGAGSPDRAGAAGLLAEVTLHRQAETPLALGIFGPAGSGKSRLLRSVLDTAGRLAAASGTVTGASAFVSRVVMARIEAVPGRDPVALLVGGVIDALAPAHAAFAEDAIHAAGDPREAARLADDRVNTLRRALDSERQTLDDLGARRARLTETVLFDGAGTRVDAFARANRGTIEGRLRAFGLSSADPIRSFKELLLDGAEPGGSGSRFGLMLQAVWGFKGQRTLLVLAVLLAALGWAAGSGADDPDRVSDWLAGFGDRFTVITDGLRAHLDLLQPIGRIAWALAALALLADLVRAGQFLGPVFKGTALLKGDLAERRRDLDGLLAHQTRRVDTLAAEAEAAGRGAEAAQRRIEGRRDGGLSDHGAALAAKVFGLQRRPEATAEAFFTRLSQGMAQGAAAAPDRILVALDGLDRLSPAELAATLGTVHRLIGRTGFAFLAALERDQAAEALGEFDPAGAAARLDRIVQISYDLGAVPADAVALTRRLLQRRPADEAAPAIVDASRSALDEMFRPFEVELMERLAPFAGGTPRGIKRFVDAYRVARADPRLANPTPAALGALAIALALDGTGAGSELAAFDREIDQRKAAVDQATDFGRAFAIVTAVTGQAGGPQDGSPWEMRRGLAVARTYGRWS